MNLNPFRRRAPAQAADTARDRKAAGPAAPVVVWGMAGRAAWTPAEDGARIRAGFCANPVGFRAVRLIAEAAAALPVVCQDMDRRHERHPLLELLDRPNDGQGRAEFLESVVGELLLTGNAWVELAGAAEGALPAALHVLRADRMRVIAGADGWPVAHEYTAGTRRRRFPIDPDLPVICHIKTFHPLDDHAGLSPLAAAATATDVHNAASRWSKSLLDNAARPSGAIVYRGADGQAAMSEDQYTRLQDEIAAHHQGAANAGRPMLLEGGLDWKPMGFSPSDMEFQKTKEAAAREIALAFGVPPMMLGIPGDATYANYQEANRAFYRLTVLPLAGKVLAALADSLGRAARMTATLAPDPDQVPALAPEREAQWRRVAEADFLTDAEKRRLLGLPAAPEGA